MHYTIRNMLPEDYPEVRSLWETIPGLLLEAADDCDGVTRYLQRNPGLSFVAEAEGKIIGTVLCGEDGRRGYLQHLCVVEACQQQGIGKALLARAIEKFSALQLHEVRIFVFKDNDAGHAFWTGLGWALRDDIYVRTFHLGGES